MKGYGARIPRSKDRSGTFARMAPSSLEPIDLLHQGIARIVGCYVVETDDGLALYDCGPTPCIPALKAGLEDARPRARRHPPSAPLPHPLRPRRGRRRARARAPRRCRCTSRRSARRTSSTPRGSSRARGGSTATASTASGASSSRSRRRTSSWSATTSLGLECFPSTGHASHHVSMLHEDGTLYAGDSMRRPHRTRTVRPPAHAAARHRPRGVGADDRGDRATRPCAARAHALRRLRRRPASTSPGCARRCSPGASASATGWTRRRSSRPPARTASPPTPSTPSRTTPRRRTGSASSGWSGTGASAAKRPPELRVRARRTRSRASVGAGSGRP